MVNTKVEKKRREINPIKLGLTAFAILFALILLSSSVYTIKAGTRGVLLTFGEASDVAVGEGLHFKYPIVQKVVKMDIKTQKYVTAASSSSADLQIVSAEVAVNYHLVAEMVPELFTNIGLAYEDRVIQPSVQEVIKSSTAQFTAEELITRRPEVKFAIEEALKIRLGPRGIVVETTSITNFEFSEEFNRAIEQKVTAEQLKLKAARDLERILIEKDQKIAQAQAVAEELRLQKNQITPELIRLREIDAQREAIAQWDGILPQFVMGGQGAIPLISLPSVGTQTG